MKKRDPKHYLVLSINTHFRVRNTYHDNTDNHTLKTKQNTNQIAING
jgi:hypothetical protein